MIGGPFYEHISERVEEHLGDDDQPKRSWLGVTLRGMRDSAVLVTTSVLCTLPLFLTGFIAEGQAPGDRRAIGWVRLSQDKEVHADVSIPQP